MSAVPPARAKRTRKGKVNIVSHRYRVRILLPCGKETAGHTNTDEDVKGKMRTVTEINKENAKTKGAHSVVTWCTYSPFETCWRDQQREGENERFTTSGAHALFLWW